MAASIVDVDASAVHACTHRFGGCEEVAHERLLPRRLGTTNLLVAQLLQARLGSDELAIDRFEVGSFSFISRVCVAMAVRNASCTLIDCSCSSATSAVSDELVVLSDVVRCLPWLIALIAQATELLNVVVILSKADRLDDDSAAPSCYS